MSRAFNGGVSADAITFAIGNAPPDEGPITMGVLAKAANTSGFTGVMVTGRATGARVWSILTSNNSGAKLFIEGDFGTGVTGLTTSWAWYVVTKASGSTTPRFHVGTFTGSAISWAHLNGSATVPDGSGPINNILLGDASSSSTWRGSEAAAAAWPSALGSDVAVEAAFTLNYADTVTAATSNAGWCVRLNQASTATTVIDDTGGGGSQTALSGTTVDADDPPAFSYALPGGGTTTVTSDLDLRWPVAATVTSDLDLRWSIVSTNTVTSDLDLRWAVRGIVTSDLDLRWQVVSDAPAAPAAISGGWWGLYDIEQENRQFLAESKLPPVACPYDGEPLLPGPHGGLYCPWGNYRYHA